jgi:hypothetical protein
MMREMFPGKFGGVLLGILTVGAFLATYGNARHGDLFEGAVNFAGLLLLSHESYRRSRRLR